MANLMDMLQGQLSEGLINQLSQQLGGTDKQQTATAAQSIMSTLTAALARNAATPEGANALSSALDRDHDGSIMDDMMGMLSGNNQPQNAKMLNGAGILKHVLGGKQGGAVDMISKMSGLGSNQAGSLMQMLAPVVMGALGQQKRQSSLDSSGIAGLLSSAMQAAGQGQQNQQNQQMGLIGRFLDQDGDGSFIDDVAGMGMNLLGKFMKK